MNNVNDRSNNKNDFQDYWRTIMTKDITSYSIEEIGNASSIPVKVVADKATLSRTFAECMIQHVNHGNQQRKRTVLIMPVGPTGQWKLAVEIAKRESVDLSNLHIVSMDEYLTEDAAHPIPQTDSFSFARFIRSNFADEATASCGFKMENWVAPDPADTENVERRIAEWGGVDVAFASVGLNGHLAFNEPPSITDNWSEEEFANSPTRIQKIAETTKATNSIFGTGGDLTKVPDYAVTIGMKQLLGARQVHVFLGWPWQCNVMRRALLGPVTMRFPASLLQNHPNARFTVTQDVADVHEQVPE
jgi:glucosamine-6-phosphate deaminase